MAIDFKIDTKDTFTTIILPNARISAKLAGDLAIKTAELRQSGSKNFIVALDQCTDIDRGALSVLLSLHDEIYSLDQSIVFTGIGGAIMEELKENEIDLMLNIAPRMDEAIDIISMEILERDLLGEE